MRSALVAHLTSIGVAASIATVHSQVTAAPAASAGKTIDIRIAGEPLGRCLPQVGADLGVDLKASRSLAGQRVALFWKRSTGAKLRRGLTELLSPKPEAGVFWVGSDEMGWRLEESVNRQRLAQVAQQAGNNEFRTFLKHWFEWLDREGLPGFQSRDKLEKQERRRIIDWAAEVSFVRALSEQDLERFLSGEPCVLRVGEMPAPLRAVVREYLGLSFGALRGQGDEKVDAQSFVLMMSNDEADARGRQAVSTRLDERGIARSRSSIPTLTQPGKRNLPTFRALARLPLPDPTDHSRRVTFTLAPERPGMPRTGRNMLRFEEVLETLAHECRLNIVADGYLRPACEIAPGFEVRDYPLHQLLTVIARIWGCDWKYLEGDESTVLVRSRSWWAEDRADVPQKLFDDLKRQFDGSHSPKLEDLALLSELSYVQIHKLVDAELLPAATGIVDPLINDNTGARPCLQFYHRLPANLKARVVSDAGLTLGSAPQELVDQLLAPTMLAQMGRFTRQVRNQFTLRITRNGGAAPGASYTVQIGAPNLSTRSWTVGLPQGRQFRPDPVPARTANPN